MSGFHRGDVGGVYRLLGLDAVWIEVVENVQAADGAAQEQDAPEKGGGQGGQHHWHIQPSRDGSVQPALRADS